MTETTFINEIVGNIKEKLSRFHRLFRIETGRQIHVEMYYDDEVWKKLKELDYENVEWFVMTPTNYGYFLNFFGTNLTFEEIYQKMGGRLKWMNKNGKDPQLHIHFWRDKIMPTGKKRQKFVRAVNWAEEFGVNFEKFVPGWWHYEKDIYSICEEFGLEVVERTTFLHDYELVK